MSNKVAMMQPSFLSWIGLFELIANSDSFIFLDDFQYVLQSHHTRNKLFRNKDIVDFYIVPVRKNESFCQPLNQVKIVPENQWKRKILQGIKLNYGKTTFFTQIYPLVESWLMKDYPSLAELNISFIMQVCDLMNIKTIFLYSSDFTKETGSHSQRSQRILELLQWANADTYLSAFGSFDYMKEDGFQTISKIPVLFQNHVPKEYPQIGSKKFIGYLSVLDALLNIGPEETLKKALAGTSHWLTWEEREEFS